MGRSRALATVAMLAIGTSGCALLASANAAHTHISGCVDEPAYSIIDIVVGSGTGVLLVGTEAGFRQPLWFAVPGVFFASGIAGLIEVHSCRKHDGPRGSSDPYVYSAPQSSYPPPSPPPPVDAGAAAVDEEPLPPPAPPGPQLRLSSDYDVGPGVDAGVGDAPATCATGSYDNCPPRFTCALDEHNVGHCVPVR